MTKASEPNGSKHQFGYVRVLHHVTQGTGSLPSSRDYISQVFVANNLQPNRRLKFILCLISL
jgi:hypothetical protein